jgi:hypothetical protein
MGFSTRRGRPRQSHLREEADRGTPELQRKRQFALTTEVMDQLLHEQVLSPAQHRAALRFRWLYRLRYGRITVQSRDISRGRGGDCRAIYPEWQQEREAEWKQAVAVLVAQHALAVVQNAVFYNHLPPPQLPLLLTGLDALTHFWERERR